MTPAARRTLGILAAAVAVMAGFQLSAITAVAREADQAASIGARTAGELASALAEGVETDTEVAGLRGTAARNDALLTARAGFVSALATADAAFTAADGKVSTEQERTGILALQQQVLAERDDPSAVTDAAAQATGVGAAVTQAVADHDAEQARLAAARAAAATRTTGASTAASPGGATAAPAVGAYDRVRAALDSVGGGHVRLEEFAGACGGATAAACASPGVIRFTPGIASWSDGRLRWAMAHELAHTYQFAVWNPLVSSAGYAGLFGGDIELLANCMAAQRGWGSGNVSCSGDQLAWAGAIWQGYVP